MTKEDISVIKLMVKRLEELTTAVNKISRSKPVGDAVLIGKATTESLDLAELEAMTGVLRKLKDVGYKTITL